MNDVKSLCNDIKESYGATHNLVELLLRHFELEVAITTERLKQNENKEQKIN